MTKKKAIVKKRVTAKGSSKLPKTTEKKVKTTVKSAGNQQKPAANVSIKKVKKVAAKSSQNVKGGAKSKDAPTGDQAGSVSVKRRVLGKSAQKSGKESVSAGKTGNNRTSRSTGGNKTKTPSKSLGKAKKGKADVKVEDIEIEIDVNNKKTSKSAKKTKKDVKVEDTGAEIDNIIKKLDQNRKKTKSTVKVPKRGLSVGVTYNKQIANLADLNKKTKLNNSDFILALLEISLNSHKYGIEFSNKSKFFWEEVIRLGQFKNIFLKFKSETLRKYWRFLSENEDVEKVLETVKKFRDSIDELDNIRLLTVISILKEYLDGKIKHLEDYLKNYTLNTMKLSKYRVTEEDIKIEGPDGKMINKKRKRIAQPLTQHFKGRSFNKK